MVNRSEIRDGMTVIAILHAARLRTLQTYQGSDKEQS